MEKTIGDIVPGHTMPEAHDQHIDHIGPLEVVLRFLKTFLDEHHDQAHKDKVSEPEGQAHVPAIPKFL